MRHLIPRRAVLLALLCAASAAWGAFPSLIHTASAVTVKATPLRIDADGWEFEVVFDTHSQPLQDDMLKSAALVAADGSEQAPLEWRGAPPGGHHRSGILRFKAMTPRPDALVLRIRRAGETAPRTFEWSLR